MEYAFFLKEDNRNAIEEFQGWDFGWWNFRN
jgi:hypothetical protein